MYPTKKKILERKIKHKKEVILLLKRANEKINNKNKAKVIKQTLYQLARIYNKKVKIKIEKETKFDHYNNETRTIHLKDPPSIITALHEFAHHIYGRSELQACRWSVQLFIKTFPNYYKNLKWKRHLLIKK